MPLADHVKQPTVIAEFNKVRERRSPSSFAVPLEYKADVIEALHTWKSAYKKQLNQGKTARMWGRVEKLLEMLE